MEETETTEKKIKVLFLLIKVLRIKFSKKKYQKFMVPL